MKKRANAFWNPVCRWLKSAFAKRGSPGDVCLFKNNTDSVWNTYGCHENFLMRRDVDFWKVTEQLIPFLVTRQIFSGAGTVLKIAGKPHYVLSQRAQHIHETTSSSTTSSQSIINIRDEPHADAESFQRLHLILGDSNMSEFATYLKVGTAALVLSMLEDGFWIPGMALDDPVKAIRDVARDPTLQKRMRLNDGRELSGLDIQRLYVERAKDYLSTQPFETVMATAVKEWERVLNALDDDPMQLVKKVDWITKKWLMESYLERKSCGWDHPRIAMIDLQYHDVNRKRGLYYLLESHRKVPKSLMNRPSNVR